eukprot:1852234-Pleurochrysis_carterae.AAC.1
MYLERSYKRRMRTSGAGSSTGANMGSRKGAQEQQRSLNDRRQTPNWGAERHADTVTDELTHSRMPARPQRMPAGRQRMPARRVEQRIRL